MALVEVLWQLLWFALLAVGAIATGFVGIGIIMLFGLFTDLIGSLYNRIFPPKAPSSKTSKK